MNINIKLKNLDLVMQSANMLDTFIDIGHFRYNQGQETLVSFNKLLNEKIQENNNIQGVTISSKSISEEMDSKAQNSQGSIVITRGKLYISYASIQNIKLDMELCQLLDTKIYKDKDRPGQSTNCCHLFKKVIEKLKIESVELKQAEVKIGAFGEVVFSVRVPFRDLLFNVDEYKDVYKNLMLIVREIYKDLLTDICLDYITLIRSIQKEKKNKLVLLESFHSRIFKDDGTIVESEVGRRCLHSFTWSHFFYDNDIYDQDELIEKICNSIEFERANVQNNMLIHETTKIMMSWSHTFFFAKEMNESSKINFIQFYKIPMEIEWGEWEFIRVLNYKANEALYEAYNKFESRKVLFQRLKNYYKSVNRFFFYSKRVLEAYDALTVSVNPVQLQLMKITNEKWQLDIAKDKFKERLSSLKEMIVFLHDRKKDINSRTLNSILFIIAILSIIDISNTIYGIVSTQNIEYIFATTLPASTMFVLSLLFYRIMKE